MKAGFDKCTGVELNYPLVLYSRIKAKRLGYRSIEFMRSDIFKTDLSVFDVAIFFGTESIVCFLFRVKFKDEPPFINLKIFEISYDSIGMKTFIIQ